MLARSGQELGATQASYSMNHCYSTRQALPNYNHLNSTALFCQIQTTLQFHGSSLVPFQICCRYPLLQQAMFYQTPLICCNAPLMIIQSYELLIHNWCLNLGSCSNKRGLGRLRVHWYAREDVRLGEVIRSLCRSLAWVLMLTAVCVNCIQNKEASGTQCQPAAS